MMKKYILLLLIFGLVFTTFDVNAKDANTLKELRSQLASYKAKQSAASSKKNQSQSEINKNKNDVYKKQKEIEDTKVRIEDAKENIEKLNTDIDETKEKMEEVLRTYEKSTGDSIYLEYIFGATSISDFIIRYSLASQIADYNEDLVNEYKTKLDETKELKTELQNKEVDLNKQIKDLQASIDKLGEEVKVLDKESLSVKDQISSTQELINHYVSIGCGENQTFDDCLAARARRSSSSSSSSSYSGSVSVASASGFLKPLNRGVVTSYYGYRYHPVTGVYKLHSGVDIGGNSEGTSVYSIAGGMVGKIIRRASCGGNQVFIYHTVNGKKYTSVYMHLLSINVSVGQNVSAYSVIGTVGGGTTYYDSCSTGAHLHLSMATGWYGSTYVDYSTYIARLFDPRTFLGIPSMGVWFYSR